MNITPMGNQPTSTQNTGQSTTQQSARERAISMLQGNSQPVPNATQVSPEELSAINGSNLNTSEATEKEEEEEKVQKEPAKDPLSSQYAALARKEKALRAQMQQFKAEQAQIQQLKAELESLKSKPSFDESKYIPRDRLKAEALAVLSEEGISYDDITQSYLDQGSIKTDPAIKQAIARLEAEAKAAREEAKQAKQMYEDNQTQAYKQAIVQITNETKQLVKSNPDAYETIQATDSIQDVVDLIEKTFKTDGTLLSVEEACQAVEDHLMEEAMKITKLKKLQLKIAENAKPYSEQKQTPVQPQTPKTLSNSMSTQRPLTARERAILAMEGKLK